MYKKQVTLYMDIHYSIELYFKFVRIRAVYPLVVADTPKVPFRHWSLVSNHSDMDPVNDVVMAR